MIVPEKRHIQIKSMGPGALLVEWPASISPDINGEVLALQQLLNESNFQFHDVIPAYHSLLLEFDKDQHKKETVEEWLMTQLADLQVTDRTFNRWEIPVRYEGEDLETLCRQKKISKEEFTSLHSGPEYRVYFIGFLPGFLYLGGLPEILHTPRRSVPRKQVPKGAVSIGGSQTGIYPQPSPGGWQLIGHTEFKWFDLQREPPSLILPGDHIQFIPV